MVAHLPVKKISDINPSDIQTATKIFINGAWHYVTYKPKYIVDKLRNMRRCGIVHIHTSIVWKIQDYILEIYTDAGRCTRPIYIVKNNVPLINDDIINKLDKNKMKWNNLISGSLNTYNEMVQKPFSEGVI